jgi:hypothetical protein
MANKYEDPNYWNEFTYWSDDVKKRRVRKTWKEIIVSLGFIGKKRRASATARNQDSGG